MERNQQDTAWKEVLDSYFKDLLDYCLPDLSTLINWDKSFTSLDKELQKITKESKIGQRLLDKLFKVYFKNGQEQWILIHIEIQAKKDKTFPERMFVYGYRIYDFYQRPIVSCAILTDNSKWRPDNFEITCAGSYLKSKFLVIKLIDYRNQTRFLEESD